MSQKERASVSSILIYLALCLVTVVILLPLLHVTAVSFSSVEHIYMNDISIFPKGFTIEMYKKVFSEPKIFNAYKNTIFYVVLGTALSLAVSSAGAYALSKKKMVFRSQFTKMIIFTMFFSGGMIPTFLTIRNLGIIDSVWAIVLPNMVSSWYLIIMRSFFSAIPEEIEESGEMDGLNDIGKFLYLVLPVSKALLATMGLFYAVGLWNSYYTPFMYLDTQKKYPLQVILRSILETGAGIDSGSDTSDEPVILESLKYATIIVSVVPIIIVYPFLQRYFVTGVLVGSVKG